MKLCYQVATPDVAIADSVTAYQGPLEKSFSDLAKLGYQGVELMTLNPSELDWEFVKKEAEKNGLKVVLVCTGEIFGQLGLSYTNPDPEKRKEAIRRSKEIIDFAAYLGANINIGRIRGQYCSELTKEQTEELAIAAFRELADYAAPKGVQIALETVTIMQTNFINTCAEGADMVDRVDRPNFRLMLDVFHLNLEEKICLTPSGSTAHITFMSIWQTTTAAIRDSADWILKKSFPHLKNAAMTARLPQKFSSCRAWRALRRGQRSI